MTNRNTRGTTEAMRVATAIFFAAIAAAGAWAASLPYTIVDTGQGFCCDGADRISAPAQGEAFYGQDAQFAGNAPSYTVGQDGLTVIDNHTGLVWTQSADTDGNGTIDSADKMTVENARRYCDALNAEAFGGRTDWRVPTIKELYSLINYNGTDPNPMATDSTSLTPFVDTAYFDFGYGDVANGERIIDAQFLTTTDYVSTVFNGQPATFGVNLADGRIKGYPATHQSYFYFVAGNTDYGKNDFIDNGDGTVSDRATGLMWTQDDSGGEGMDWQDALACAQARNAKNYLGYSDWRLPNAKELQSIVDYTRSPDTTESAAIDPVFHCTAIVNLAGQTDYPFYWTSTNFQRFDGGASNAVYVAFGRGLGSMDGMNVIDVHGAGCPRSDPKQGDPSDYPSWGHGPQGDVQRVYNHVRLVRGGSADTPEEPIAPAFNKAQVLSIVGSTRFYAGIFDYATFQWSATIEATESAQLPYDMPKGSWTGLFLYDYEATKWTETGFVFRGI